VAHGVMFPSYAEIDARCRSFGDDPRYIRFVRRPTAMDLANTGLFLPPSGFGEHPRCYRCGVTVMFTVLAAGTDLVSAHREAVRAAGVQCTVARPRQPSRLLRDYNCPAPAATPSAKKHRS
jgi:hypothetical protein